MAAIQGLKREHDEGRKRRDDVILGLSMQAVKATESAAAGKAKDASNARRGGLVNLLAVAASAMHRVMIPPHVLVHIQHFPNVLGVVQLVAALAEANGKRDGTAFLSQHDAAAVLGKAPGAISRAFSIAVRLGALELVSQGARKYRNGPGVASVYRVPWICST